MNEEIQLGYISSASMLVETETVKAEDEADITTLERVLALLRDRQAYYQTIDSLSLADEVLTVTEQLAVNKKVLFHLQELQGLLIATITKVKEKQNGR